MVDERILGDNPSIEVQIGVLVKALNNHIEYEREINQRLSDNQDETKKSIERLILLQREQNSNVANVISTQREHKTWINAHNDWHGEEDKKVAARLNNNKGKQEILIAQWKFIVFLLSTGIIGAGFGKIGNLLGWW